MPLDTYDDSDQDHGPTMDLTKPVTADHAAHDEQVKIGKVEPPFYKLIHYPNVRGPNRVTQAPNCSANNKYVAMMGNEP